MFYRLGNFFVCAHIYIPIKRFWTNLYEIWILQYYKFLYDLFWFCVIVVAVFFLVSYEIYDNYTHTNTYKYYLLNI